MAKVFPDWFTARLATIVGCALVLLALTLTSANGAEAAKKSRSACVSCKATASKSGRGKVKGHKSHRPNHGKAAAGAAPNRTGAAPTPTATTPAATAQPTATITPSPSAPVISAPIEEGATTVKVGEAPRAGGGAASTCASSVAASVTAGMGSFSAMVHPSSCWRPYSSSSPFNSAIASGATSTGGSSAQISRLLAGGPISYMVAGDPYKDYGTAVYYPTESDPTYTIHCLEAWGRCALEGEQVHLPQGATPSGPWPIGNGNADSHLTIVDQSTGWEYDLWNVREIGNGRIVTGWGGKTQIEGEGLGSDAVAAQFGSLAGIIRPVELRAGQIDHALALTIPCTVGYVAPATKGGLECADAGMPTANAMPMGAHLQLQLSNSEIEAMNAPLWKKAILRAFATYGAYVEDTTGASSQWGLKFESPNGMTSLGGPDEYVELAKSLGLEAQDYNGNGYPEYWFDVAGGVEWNKLRVVG